MLRKLLCFMGFHDLYADTTAVNLGTDDTPVYMTITKMRCKHCPWKERE